METKDYNFMIDGQNVFHQTVKNGMRTYDNNRIKLQLVKVIITQLAINHIILISKNIIS